MIKNESMHIETVIAVSSAKGGVGKSTVAANLAASLARQGFKVGLLDADIYGPSIPACFGVEDQKVKQVTATQQGKAVQLISPIQVDANLFIMSIGFLVDNNAPMVWRGPMATGALMQLLNQTQWGELDFLLIDMPPGTGDIQLTLSQKFNVDGAVIVTTSQALAILDAKKGIEMFNKVSIPTLGIVENMAWLDSQENNKRVYIFGRGKSKQLAEDYQVALLGQIPIYVEDDEASEVNIEYQGLLIDQSQALTDVFYDINQKLLAEISEQSQQTTLPELVILEDE